MSLLQDTPHMMQLKLVQALGASLNKTNFCQQALLTSRFLQRNQQEYVALHIEIAALQLEAQVQALRLESLG